MAEVAAVWRAHVGRNIPMSCIAGALLTPDHPVLACMRPVLAGIHPVLASIHPVLACIPGVRRRLAHGRRGRRADRDARRLRLQLRARAAAQLARARGWHARRRWKAGDFSRPPAPNTRGRPGMLSRVWIRRSLDTPRLEGACRRSY